jgi:predicted negative regulator of RcsB-dependent stress response
MATHLDLEEQEQIDRIKHFWRRWGNLITWTLVAVLAAYSGWQGWQWWQRDQAAKAGAMFDELDRAASTNDVERTARVFADLRERFPKTAFAQQGGLLAARVQHDGGKLDDAAQSLRWVSDNARDEPYRVVARLRLSALLIQQQKAEEALKLLDGVPAAGFDPLLDDRRGDVLAVLGRQDEATAAWRKAHAAMDPKVEYRRLIEAKLTAAGAAPAPDSAASAPGGAK